MRVCASRASVGTASGLVAVLQCQCASGRFCKLCLPAAWLLPVTYNAVPLLPLPSIPCKAIVYTDKVVLFASHPSSHQPHPSPHVLPSSCKAVVYMDKAVLFPSRRLSDTIRISQVGCVAGWLAGLMVGWELQGAGVFLFRAGGAAGRWLAAVQLWQYA